MSRWIVTAPDGRTLATFDEPRDAYAYARKAYPIGGFRWVREIKDCA